MSLIVHQPHLPNRSIRSTVTPLTCRVVKICVRAYVCMSVREVSVRLSAACECARSYLCLWPVMQIQPSLCLGRGGSRSAWRCLCLCLFLRLCKRVWLCYVLESTQLDVRGRVNTCVCACVSGKMLACVSGRTTCCVRPITFSWVWVHRVDASRSGRVACVLARSCVYLCPVAGDACRDRVKRGGVAGLDGVRIHAANRCRYSSS